MGMDDKDMNKVDEGLWTDDVVFIPDEAMQVFDRAYFKMRQAREELQKFANEMKRL